jgi:hypothetical protein
MPARESLDLRETDATPHQLMERREIHHPVSHGAAVPTWNQQA